ncbi:MAG: hypothetical protein M3361_10835 [Candidatus Tectomicrobia bacterium]|nr:hypothetical protein [Candidatus Tectomicrobia bacterium]
MKPLSDKDVEYHREYSKQYYIKKQLGEIGTVPRRQAQQNKLPYCFHCKTRAWYDVVPAEGGLLQRVCRNCGQGDLYVSGNLSAR